MTLYAYSLDIDDSGMVALTAAIDSYKAKCRSEIDAGNTVPYRPHLKQLELIEKGLFASARLISQYVPDGKGGGTILLGGELFERDPGDELYIPPEGEGGEDK